MKKKGLLKKGVSLLLAVSVIFTAGCGKTGGEVTNSSKDAMSNETESQAKGRYLESDITLPEGIDRISGLRQLDDGSILLLDTSKGLVLSSSDNGETWTEKPNTMEKVLGSCPYISKSVLGRDGSVFLEYVISNISDENTEETNKSKIKEDVDQQADETDEVVEISHEFEDAEILYQYGFIDTEGNFKEIKLTQNREERWSSGIEILKDGTILCAFGKQIYKVNTESLELEELFSVSQRIIQINELHNNLIVLTDEGTQCFSLETKEELEDSVLKDFVKEIVSSNPDSFTDFSFPILFCEGDEESIYSASSKGLFRHVKGGTVMEEIIKENLTSLSDPSLSLQSMLMLKDGSFFIAFGKAGGATLKSYTYDSEAPSVPKNKITVYGLNENINIRQAISDYQKKNTDVYIEYEVGMTGKDGTTKEDAIRTLNTEILSGEGADLFLLDELPISSYMEKGILEDLSPIFANQLKDKEYFENVLNAYKMGDKLYAVPSRFSIPLIAGKAEDIERVNDLDSFAECMKELRSKKENGSLIGAYSEENIILTLYDVCAPAWMDEKGMLKKDEIIHFLTKAKEIFEAESQNIPQSDLEKNRELRSEFENIGSSMSYGEVFLNAGTRAMSFLVKDSELITGNSAGIMSDFSTLSSVRKKMDHAFAIKAFHGQSKNVFIPNTILGVNAQTKSKDIVLDFVAFILSSGSESSYTVTGYPVEKNALEACFTNPEGDSSGMSMAFSEEEGNDIIILDIEWPTEDEINELKDTINNLSTASITDSNLKKAVLELAPDALNGTKDVESVANDIVNKMQIYLSE